MELSRIMFRTVDGANGLEAKSTRTFPLPFVLGGIEDSGRHFQTSEGTRKLETVYLDSWGKLPVLKKRRLPIKSLSWSYSCLDRSLCFIFWSRVASYLSAYNRLQLNVLELNVRV